MTFNEVIEQLRDGKAYDFGHIHLAGYFYKAPFPSDNNQTAIDGAHSAITYWENTPWPMPASPTLMLYDFDEDTEWYCHEATTHPSMRPQPLTPAPNGRRIYATGRGGPSYEGNLP